MDKVVFKILNKENNGYHYKLVSILINDTDLIEKLTNYELHFIGCEGINRGYSGLSPENLYNHLVRPGEFDKDENGKVAILECECGCEGCWPFKIKIIETNEKIIWTEFEELYRSIDALGQFEFHKDEYYKQIEKLKNLF